MRSTRRTRTAGRLVVLVVFATVAVAVLATVVGMVVAAAPAALERSEHSVSGTVSLLLGVLAAALFLGGGVMRVARWRIVGDLRSLLMGAALIVLGGAAIPLTSLAGVIIGDDHQSMLRAVTAVTTTGVTVVLVLAALTSRGDSRPRPALLLTASLCAALLFFVSGVAVHLAAPELLRADSLPPAVVRGTLLCAAWLYAGLEATLRSEQRPWAGRVAPLLGCMAVSELLLVIGALDAAGTWRLGSALLVAFVARRQLDEAARTPPREDPWGDELRHDALNALAALRASVTLLERYDGVLDAPASERLRTAALGEIGHLEHLFIRGDRPDSEDFDVAQVVIDVVETQRATGLLVALDVRPSRAHGRPGDVATALRNLLVNAGRHGGGVVTVRTVDLSDTVEIIVSDEGPGLSDGQVATLFQRGARGPRSQGSGLGLHVSRVLMRQLGGDVELRRHRGGAMFALVLPASAPAGAMPPSHQRRASVHLWVPRPDGVPVSVGDGR